MNSLLSVSLMTLLLWVFSATMVNAQLAQGKSGVDYSKCRGLINLWNGHYGSGLVMDAKGTLRLSGKAGDRHDLKTQKNDGTLQATVTPSGRGDVTEEFIVESNSNGVAKIARVYRDELYGGLFRQDLQFSIRNDQCVLDSHLYTYENNGKDIVTRTYSDLSLCKGISDFFNRNPNLKDCHDNRDKGKAIPRKCITGVPRRQVSALLNRELPGVLEQTRCKCANEGLNDIRLPGAALETVVREGLENGLGPVVIARGILSRECSNHMPFINDPTIWEERTTQGPEESTGSVVR